MVEATDLGHMKTLQGGARMPESQPSIGAKNDLEADTGKSGKPLLDDKARTFMQRRILTKRIYEIIEEGVIVKIRSPFSQFDLRIPFETLGDSWFRTTYFPKYFLWPGLIFTFIAVVVAISEFFGGETEGVGAILFYGLPGLAFLGATILSRTVWVGIPSTPGPLMLYADRPSTAEMQVFLKNLQFFRKNYMRENYFQSPVYESPVKDLERLAWLHEKGVITDDEFRALKKQLVEDSQQEDQPRIGF